MSKYAEYYIPVTLLLKDTLQNIKILVENDPWKDIGQASPATLNNIYDYIKEVEREIGLLEDEYIKAFPMQ